MPASWPKIRFRISNTNKGEGKGTVMPVLNEAPCHEGTWRSGVVQNSGTYSVSVLDGVEWSGFHTGRGLRFPLHDFRESNQDFQLSTISRHAHFCIETFGLEDVTSCNFTALL
jgi:hypothetical protein